jgi:TrmH family RNA methyltransferase
MVDITSGQNPQIKLFAQYKKRSFRDETSRFLIEGYRELKRAVDAKIEIETLLYAEELFLGTNENKLIQILKQRGVEILSCSAAPFEKLSYRDRPDGLIAVARMMHWDLSAISFRKGRPPFVVVAESIEKPGNLGSILRSSDAVGVDGVIVCDRCTDVYNPNVVRASVGTLFTQPVVEANFDQTIAFLKKNHVAIVATTPSTTQEYTQADLTGPVAIIMGTEQLGLTQKWLDQADIQVRIPMHGVADSLNVATATTLLLYEVLRQRS